MSEQSWVLRGIDPETRQQAEAEAARRGMNLADYIADVVLQRALLEQMSETAPETPAEDAAAPAETAEPADNFLLRHRLEALERRLGLSVGGLDGAVHALDSSMFGLAQRIDDVEALTADTADAFDQAVHDIGANLNTLRKRLADAEEQTGALGEAQDAARTEFGQRCETIEQQVGLVANSANAAHDAIAQLSAAQDALKYAVADDFSAFAQESMARLSAGLEEVRTAADTAAAQADAAVAQLVTELRAMRDEIEARVQEGQQTTRQQVHNAAAEANQRIAALAERVGESERLAQSNAEHLRAQIADVEDAAQTALEETAESLRQAGASLAAEFARATRDNRAALESVHADLNSEIGELRERQNGGLNRLKQLDAATDANAAAIAAVRDLLQRSLAESDERTHAALAEAQAEVSNRLASMGARVANVELVAAEGDRALQADIERVEACALAALEKQAKDRAEGDAAAMAKLEELRQRLDAQAAAQDAFQSGALARLKLVETAGAEHAELKSRIAQIEQDLGGRALDRGFDERLLRLEARAESTQSEQAIAALRGQIGGLAAQFAAAREDNPALHMIDELREQVSGVGAQAAGTQEQLQSVARTLSHLGAQQADAITRTEERLRRLETSAPAADVSGLDALEQRLEAIENRQADAFEAMRADIEAFVADNMKRLETLESAVEAPAYDVAAEFQTLRRRIEERVLGVEQRSVRALEQLADTMSVLERRLHEGDEPAEEARALR